MVDAFREYLRFPTVQPNPDYGPAVQFLKELGHEMGLQSTVLELTPTKLILVLKWTGSDPELDSIFLNSHMDVVPVYKDKWTCDPFGAEMDKEGNIYGRGSQDMKCVTIQYLEAIRKLKNEGFVPRRTIYVSVVPDEEIGGLTGMGMLVQSEYFKSLNIGFSLDEGIASPDQTFPVFYGERTGKAFRLTCHGNPGHGSLFVKNTAAEKFAECLSAVQNFRNSEQRRLEEDPQLTLGDVTTCNLTLIEGGVQTNVVPATISAVFDLRLAASLSFSEFSKQVFPQADDNEIIIKPIIDMPQIQHSSLESPFCKSFFSALDELEIESRAMIFPAGTDGRYIRGTGIPVLGFSPMNNTPVLLHDHDEFLNVNTFLRGIDIYQVIIQKISV